VVVNSFRTWCGRRKAAHPKWNSIFIHQRLALLLTSWQATTFLVGEYVEGEIRDIPFSASPMASFGFPGCGAKFMCGKLQIVKLSGQASGPGLHTFRITQAGLQAFSRTLGLLD